jgi:hypothetical protein
MQCICPDSPFANFDEVTDVASESSAVHSLDGRTLANLTEKVKISVEDLKGMACHIALYKEAIDTIQMYQDATSLADTLVAIDEAMRVSDEELEEDLQFELEGVGEEKNEYDYADGWLVKDDEVVKEETPSPKKKRTRPEVDELDIAQYVLKYKKYRKLVEKHRPEIIEG